jgi:hypothetical protein
MNRRPTQAELCATRPGNGQLRVRFDWSHDRFGHLFVGCGADAPAGAPETNDAWMRSLEGNSQEDWPASPAFQQLDHCPLAEGRSGLLLVGMAGRSHWSLAVVVRDNQLVLEVACRIQAGTEQLRSTYALAPDVHVTSTDQTVLLERLLERSSPDAPAPRVIVHPDRDTTRVGFDPAARLLEIRPLKPPVRLPATVRWSYRLALAPA